MAEDTVPSDTRLCLYLSARYLQELQLALRFAGVPARYERPGIDGIVIPRLNVERFRDVGSGLVGVCAIPRVFDARSLTWKGPDPRWWFWWWEPPAEIREPICPAVDMNEAARLIAVRLRE